ncbi:MAG: radical SAM-associated putative lipoprotein [Alistipes sp.]|nr:radical SAM-associated putative lipoprotein [Alistipes sp.]
MKNFIVKLTKMLCVAVLGVLGFSACSDDPESASVAYGVRVLKYCYKGTVTDEDGNPIKGINVVMKGRFDSKESSLTISTDDNGEFKSGILVFSKDNVSEVEFVDVDGEANGGEFKSSTLKNGDMTSKDTHKEENYDLEYSATVKLKRK